MTDARRVLMIGLDSAEPILIERWIADDTLPTLRRLRARGSYRRLASSAAWLAGSPWPTFYTGHHPPSTGSTISCTGTPGGRTWCDWRRLASR